MIEIVEIYADVLFLFLMVSDYVLLRLLSVLTGKKAVKSRLLAGALAGSAIALTLGIVGTGSAVRLLVAAPLTGSVMLGIGFADWEKKEFLRSLFLLYFCIFCMGGFWNIVLRSRFLWHFAYSGILFAGMLFFICQFVKKGRKIMRELVLHRSQSTEVCLKVQGKKAYCKGFWDSGNSLTDPITGKAVVLLEKGIMEKYQIPIPVKGFRVIPFHSVGMDNGVLKGFVADELSVRDENGYERCFGKTVVAIYEGKLSIKEDYQMILNPHI